MRKPDETVESYWSSELGEKVEIREFREWNEYDLYLGGSCVKTFVSLEAMEQWLGHYYLVRDYGLGRAV